MGNFLLELSSVVSELFPGNFLLGTSRDLFSPEPELLLESEFHGCGFAIHSVRLAKTMY